MKQALDFLSKIQSQMVEQWILSLPTPLWLLWRNHCSQSVVDSSSLTMLLHSHHPIHFPKDKTWQWKFRALIIIVTLVQLSSLKLIFYWSSSLKNGTILGFLDPTICMIDTKVWCASCRKFLTYRKVVSSNTSCLETYAGFFKLLMKKILDPYVLWLLTKSWFPNS